MNRIVVAIAAAAVSLLVGACGKSSKTADTTARPTSASPNTEGLPTVPDFEEEAASQITADNADQELDSLEKEVSQ